MDTQPYLDSQATPTTETLAAFVTRARRERSYGVSYLAQLCGCDAKAILAVEEGALPEMALLEKLDPALNIGKERLARLIENSPIAATSKDVAEQSASVPAKKRHHS